MFPYPEVANQLIEISRRYMLGGVGPDVFQLTLYACAQQIAHVDWSKLRIFVENSAEGIEYALYALPQDKREERIRTLALNIERVMLDLSRGAAMSVDDLRVDFS